MTVDGRRAGEGVNEELRRKNVELEEKLREEKEGREMMTRKKHEETKVQNKVSCLL